MQLNNNYTPENLLEALHRYDEEELNASGLSAGAASFASTEIGYFCTLNADFKSTEEEIRK